MVKLYVLFNTDNILFRVSNIFGTGREVKCNTAIDFNKLQGYEILDDELIFNEDGSISIVEHLKEDTLVHELESILRDYEGRTNLNISISTEKEI